MKKLLFLIAFASLISCSHHQLETARTRYQSARIAQEEGRDLEALLQWKAIVNDTSTQIDTGKFLTTNYFLRASAQIELGNWDLAIADLKQIHPEELSKEEFWIYPLYLILMGDYYSQQGLNSVAQNFYQSVLKKSSLKSSPVYLLALERDVNNTIHDIEAKAAKSSDPQKMKQKEYEALAKDVSKYIEDYPFSGVSHFLLADLEIKTGSVESAMEHLLAALEMGLPTADLQKSAEFQLANLLASHPRMSDAIRATLLARGIRWWSEGTRETIFRAGENTVSWLSLQGVQVGDGSSSDAKVRYLAIQSGEKLTILLWEKL